MDLLSVLLHELGHVLGLSHDAGRCHGGDARARRPAHAQATGVLHPSSHAYIGQMSIGAATFEPHASFLH